MASGGVESARAPRQIKGKLTRIQVHAAKMLEFQRPDLTTAARDTTSSETCSLLIVDRPGDCFSCEGWMGWIGGQVQKAKQFFFLGS